MQTRAEAALGDELRVHRRLARAGTFVDIGAHVGDFTFAMADLPGLDLVVIEPLPHAMAELRRRALLDGVPLRTFETALSDRAGRLRITAPVLAGSGPVWQWASAVKDFSAVAARHAEIVAVEAIDVAVTTLDALGLTGVRAIKLDAEGAEPEVLAGGFEVLRTQRPVVTVELEERHRAGCTRSVPAFMRGLGYAGWFLLDGVARPIEAFDPATMQHASASPASGEYSDPYVNCFVFVPKEAATLAARLATMESRGTDADR